MSEATTPLIRVQSRSVQQNAAWWLPGRSGTTLGNSVPLITSISAAPWQETCMSMPFIAQRLGFQAVSEENWVGPVSHSSLSQCRDPRLHNCTIYLWHNNFKFLLWMLPTSVNVLNRNLRVLSMYHIMNPHISTNFHCFFTCLYFQKLLWTQLSVFHIILAKFFKNLESLHCMSVTCSYLIDYIFLYKWNNLLMHWCLCDKFHGKSYNTAIALPHAKGFICLLNYE